MNEKRNKKKLKKCNLMTCKYDVEKYAINFVHQKWVSGKVNKKTKNNNNKSMKVTKRF